MMFTPRAKGLGAENFIKLNDREHIVGIFKGDIYTFRRHWVGSKSEECKGAGCVLCAADPDGFPAFRFRVNMIFEAFEGKAPSQFVAKIFEGGGTVYDELTKISAGQDLAEHFIKIERRGLKTNTTYLIDIIDKPIPAGVKAKLDAVELLALS